MVTIDEQDRAGRKFYEAEKLPVGRTVGDTFRVIGRGWPKLYGLSLIVLVVSLPFAILFAQQLGNLLVRAADPSRTDIPLAVPRQMPWREFGAFYAVQILVTLYVFGAMSDGAANLMASGQARFASSLKVGVTRFLPMLVATIVFYLPLAVCFVLLVVPGLIFGAAYGLAPTLTVIERCGPFASFSRSAVLTRGNRWRCIGVTLLLLVIPGVAFFFVDNLLANAIGRQYNVVFSTCANFFLLPIYYVFPAVLAFNLRRLKEGGAPSAVADVF